MTFTNFAAACPYRDSWDRLAIEHGDLFASFDWHALWWHWYGHGRLLRLNLFFDGHRLVGVVPLFEELLWIGPVGVRTVRLAGADHTIAPATLAVDPNYVPRVAADLLLSVGDQWDIVEFGHLSPITAVVDAFSAAALRSLRSVQVVHAEEPLPRMVIALPDSVDAYLSTLSSRERHNIRQENRRLDREFAVIRSDALADQSPEAALNQFIRLHQEEWTAKGHRGHFADWPDARPFHHALTAVSARAGRLRLRAVRAAGETLAMSYAVRFGQWVHYLLSARSLNPRWHFCFPGRVSAYDLFSTSITEGARFVDLGLGEYEYKAKLGATRTSMTRLLLVRTHQRTRGRMLVLRALSLMHELLGYRLWYLHLSRLFPRWQGGMNDAWIHTRLWPGDAPALRRTLRSLLLRR